MIVTPYLLPLPLEHDILYGFLFARENRLFTVNGYIEAVRHHDVSKWSLAGIFRWFLPVTHRSVSTEFDKQSYVIPEVVQVTVLIFHSQSHQVVMLVVVVAVMVVVVAVLILS